MRVDLVSSEFFEGMYHDGVKFYDAKPDYLDIETAITIRKMEGHEVWLHQMELDVYDEKYAGVGFPDNFSDFDPSDFSESRQI